ncbi:MAG: glycosyltransferase family 4 protein, partial [Gemmatimonadaceae bacterium]
EKMKGTHLLVDAFTRYKGANLLLAGSGRQESSLKRIADGHDNIRFLGNVDSAAVERLMRHAIALIVPSIGFEVFPTTVLEANAQSTPVIANRLGPLPEMLHGHGGITYEDESELVAAMEALRIDPAARNAIGMRGHERYLAEWTPEQHLARYFDLILKLKSEKVSFA